MKKVDLLAKVVKKCCEISTNSKTDVFFRYDPHVDTYDVEWVLNGWTGQNDEYTYLNTITHISMNNLENTLKELDKLWELIEESNLRIN